MHSGRGASCGGLLVLLVAALLTFLALAPHTPRSLAVLWTANHPLLRSAGQSQLVSQEALQERTSRALSQILAEPGSDPAPSSVPAPEVTGGGPSSSPPPPAVLTGAYGRGSTDAGLNGGSVAVIAVGGVLALALIAGFTVCFASSSGISVRRTSEATSGARRGATMVTVQATTIQRPPSTPEVPMTPQYPTPDFLEPKSPTAFSLSEP